MAAAVAAVVVLHRGVDIRFQPDVQAADILRTIIGPAHGYLRDMGTQFRFAGSMRVPAGQYDVITYGVAHVHLVLGKTKEPEIPENLDADGCVSFLPLQERVERLGHQLSGIAIVDEECERPAYQRLESYKHQLRDGQHVYLRADPKGGKLSWTGFWGRGLGGLHQLHHATLLVNALSAVVHASPVRRARNMAAFFVVGNDHLHQLLGKRSVLPREQQQWQGQQQQPYMV